MPWHSHFRPSPDWDKDRTNRGIPTETRHAQNYARALAVWRESRKES